MTEGNEILYRGCAFAHHQWIPAVNQGLHVVWCRSGIERMGEEGKETAWLQS